MNELLHYIDPCARFQALEPLSEKFLDRRGSRMEIGGNQAKAFFSVCFCYQMQNWIGEASIKWVVPGAGQQPCFMPRILSIPNSSR